MSVSCRSCGHRSSRWFGRCPECGEWGAATETTTEAAAGLPIATLDGPLEVTERFATGIGELDRVLGGGLVSAEAVLLAGEPGIGKSTLVLQLMHGLARNSKASLLVTGEESPAQVALRARRLQIPGELLRVVPTTDLEAILATAEQAHPDVLVVDSVQTLASSGVEQGAGSVPQVRACAAELVAFAKRVGTTVILVGHVTKEGTVAGPKMLEHMVDAVLNLEGERTGSLRLLRAMKNRFGSCEETGVFMMESSGLSGVEDPSSLFLSDRRPEVAGSIVFPGLEGQRSLLVEIQALTAPGAPGNARRIANGLDGRRLSLLLAVLFKRAEMDLSATDVFATAAGGITVREPAADLPLCLALASAAKNRPVSPGLVAFGEVGLGGEIRRVPGIERRLREAARVGFEVAIVPPAVKGGSVSIDLRVVSDLHEALDIAFPREATRVVALA